MSALLKLVYDTSVLRQRYTDVHQELFGISLGRFVRLGGQPVRPDYGTQVEKLGTLTEDLQDLRGQLARLEPGQLTQRAGRELRAALTEYIVALEDSVRKLRVICERSLQAQQGAAPLKEYSVGDYRRDRIAYDDAIQHHKRLATRLNQLLSSF
jgi:hypothetical protein